MNVSFSQTLRFLPAILFFATNVQAAEVVIGNVPVPETLPSRSPQVRFRLVDGNMNGAWKGMAGRSQITFELNAPLRVTSFGLLLGKTQRIRKVVVEASNSGNSFSEIHSVRKLGGKRGELLEVRGFDVTAKILRLKGFTKRARNKHQRRKNVPSFGEVEIRELQDLGGVNPTPTASPSQSPTASPSVSPSTSPSSSPTSSATPTPTPLNFKSTELASVNSNGNQSEGDSTNPSLSDNGRFVAFDAIAKNFLQGSSSTARTVFVRDRQTGITEHVGKNNSGTLVFSQDPSLSGDGRYVAYTGATQVWVYDRQLGQRELVSQSTGGIQSSGACREPFISANGQFVSFQCFDTNLVGGDNNNYLDIFVRDRLAGTTVLVSKSSAGQIGNSDSNQASISDNGRYVVWDSRADNLVNGDGNATADVFVHDLQTANTSLVSLNMMGLQGNDESDGAEISGNGDFVVFQSFATNLVSGSTNRNIFLHNLTTDENILVTADLNGLATAENFHPSVSTDGRFVAFDSPSADLVPGDNNGFRDTFVHDSAAGKTILLSRSTAGTLGNADSAGGMGREKSMSGDGRHVAFLTEADNLFVGDSNNRIDVVIAELQ